MNSKEWNRLLAGIAMTAPIPIIAYAQTYFTEEQAAATLFPKMKLKASWITLSPEEVKSIEKSSGERVKDSRVRIWKGPKGEIVIIDRVLGKHEFITYAIGITKMGKVKGVEIMDYRESYGYEIRRKEWRQLFAGKGIQDPIKLDKDIPNISGATLSSAHVTNGVRRVLHTYEIIKNKA